MRTFSTFAAIAALTVSSIACGPKQDSTQQPAAAPTASTAYPGYPPPQAGYGQPQPAPAYGQYPQQQQPAQAAPAPMPQAAPPSATAAMAVPGPVAFTCQNDVPCGTHHCNTQYGKCAFPCQTNVDCITPNACVMGLCVPPMPGAPAGH